MNFRAYTPTLPLSQYISSIVYYDDLQVDFSVERLLPDGSIFLLIDLHDTPKRLYHSESLEKYTTLKGGWISGQQKGFITFEAAKGSSMIVVCFKPGGAFPFLGIPASEVNNTVVQFDAIWGGMASQFREQLLEAPGIDEKLKKLELLLLTIGKPRLEAHATVQHAVYRIVTTPQHISSALLANTLGISQKHLISLFDKHVGLTPKLLSRILRFQSVLQTIEQSRKIEWSTIVYECGYYDQAHFIKDFQEFSGMNPSMYLTQKGEYLNFVPVK